ncbi:MAG: DUF4262 domain-containing protein, partial [Chlorobia bacterium]|nr:DUF4262 domain-containing protein [Fimbriimonadaceae bacterium]
MDPVEQRIHDDIAKYGWHVMLVHCDDGSTFGYTIGIHQTYGKPELLMCGLSPQGIHAFCNKYGEDVKSGIEYKAGDLAGHWFENEKVKMVFIEIHDGWKPTFLGKLVDAMNDNQVPALQAIWSDEQGLMPLMEGFNPDLEGKQFF